MVKKTKKLVKRFFTTSKIRWKGEKKIRNYASSFTFKTKKSAQRSLNASKRAFKTGFISGKIKSIKLVKGIGINRRK